MTACHQVAPGYRPNARSGRPLSSCASVPTTSAALSVFFPMPQACPCLWRAAQPCVASPGHAVHAVRFRMQQGRAGRTNSGGCMRRRRGLMGPGLGSVFTQANFLLLLLLRYTERARPALPTTPLGMPVATRPVFYRWLRAAGGQNE